MKQITSGNFKDIIVKKNGDLWVMGHFVEEDSPFHTKDLEIKWGLHHAGESKGSIGTNTKSKTLTILIRGKVSLKFPEQNREIILEKEGDYVYYDKGVSHNWSVLEESLTIAIRWPSIPGDQKKK
jgi:hypothetical protein